jgi:ribosomal-protein-alanine N-acetyltransferase
LGSNRFEVRRAKYSDLDEVWEVEVNSFDDPFPRFLLSRLLRENASIFMVAVAGERVVGYCVASLEAESAHLISMAILPGFRRRGVARSLLRQLIGCLSERNVRVIFLEVKVNNRSAIELYSSLGALRVGVVRNYYSDGTSALKMSLPVKVR